ncbi:hypothetical protein Q1695_001457 [Nippostrongylus brasiliensis]|nr:hypothetical protein Q1695_001457 [Nippostrongylus brasiliensis]
MANTFRTPPTLSNLTALKARKVDRCHVNRLKRRTPFDFALPTAINAADALTSAEHLRAIRAPQHFSSSSSCSRNPLTHTHLTFSEPLTSTTKTEQINSESSTRAVHTQNCGHLLRSPLTCHTTRIVEDW